MHSRMQVRANSIVADFLMGFALLLAVVWVALGAYQLRSYGFDLTTGACRVDTDLSVAVYATRVRGGTVEVDVP